MVNSSGNLNSIGLILHDLITIVFCTKSGLAWVVFFHKGIIDNELLPLSREKTFPRRNISYWVIPFLRKKQKKIKLKFNKLTGKF